MRIMKFSLEENASGATVIEHEKVFYARIESRAVLEKYLSTSESQEQWQIKIPKSQDNLAEGKVRVRLTTAEKQSPKYVQTIKIKNSSGTDNETSFEVSKDVFEQFKLMSNNGMIKQRFFIPIEGREEKWEVDVYKQEDGKTVNWVKIDYEFKSPDKTIPSLPEIFKDVISGDTKDPEEQNFISTLYENVFLVNAKYQ